MRPIALPFHENPRLHARPLTRRNLTASRARPLSHLSLPIPNQVATRARVVLAPIVGPCLIWAVHQRSPLQAV